MGIKYLLDTNIIIYHLNGNPVVSKFIDDNFNQIAISFITFIEVLQFSFNKKEEEKAVREFLDSFKHINLNRKISEQTILIRKTKKIKIPDAIIAGTAKIGKLILVTRNEKDFKKFDISLFNPLD